MSILDIRDMTQGFGDKVIFNNVSFKLEKGEHIGLVGANGQGKTTFMKLITKSILPDKGTIEWSSKVKIGFVLCQYYGHKKSNFFYDTLLANNSHSSGVI